jgi:hypothetical protein
MLIATPNQGCVQRNPNCVSTKPAPNPNIDARARKIAMVMGALPQELSINNRGSAALRLQTMRK